MKTKISDNIGSSLLILILLPYAIGQLPFLSQGKTFFSCWLAGGLFGTGIAVFMVITVGWSRILIKGARWTDLTSEDGLLAVSTIFLSLVIAVWLYGSNEHPRQIRNGFMRSREHYPSWGGECKYESADIQESLPQGKRMLRENLREVGEDSL